MSNNKERLDRILVEKGLVKTGQRARAMIMAGKILVNNQPIDKPGSMICRDDNIILKEKDHPYASRGGLKLFDALQKFQIDVKNNICLDVGASTGGFTDCLLQHGARRIYAVDVGYGQLDWKLRNDPRVIVIERTNIRYMDIDAISEKVDIVTIDVSFISLKIVVPAILKFIKKDAIILALIKPQFEVGKGQVGKKGVVRDPAQHEKIIKELSCFFSKAGLFCKSVVPSPVLGPKGNREFMIYLNLS